MNSQEFRILSREEADAVSHSWGTNTQPAGGSNSRFPKCRMSSTGTHNSYPATPKTLQCFRKVPPRQGQTLLILLSCRGHGGGRLCTEAP